MTHVLGVQLHDGEERCAVIRSAVFALMPRVTLGIAWTLVPFFFFFPLLRLGSFGIFFAAMLASSGLAYLFRLRVSWYHTALVATTTRVIDVHRRGFAPAVIVAAPWTDVTVISAAPRAPFGIGTVRVDFVASRDFSFVLRGVYNPKRASELLHEVQYLRTHRKKV